MNGSLWLYGLLLFFSLLEADSLIQALRVKRLHLGDGTRLEDAVILIQEGKILEAGNQIAIPPRCSILLEGNTLEATPGLINFSCPLFLLSSETQNDGQSVTFAPTGFDPYHPQWKNQFEPSRLQIGDQLLDGLRYEPISENFQQELFQSGVTTYVLDSGSSRWIEGTSSVLRLKKASIPYEILLSNHALCLKISNDLTSATKQTQLFESFLHDNVAYQERKEESQKAHEEFEKTLKQWKAEKQQAEQEKKEFKKETPKRPELFKPDNSHEYLLELRQQKKTLYLETTQENNIRAWNPLLQKFKLKIVWKKGTASKILSERKEPVVLLPNQIREQETRHDPKLTIPSGTPLFFGTGETIESARFLRLMISQWIALGISPETCIRGLTSEPAKHLGLENKIGSLKKGLDADIVIFEGDPFHSLSRVRMVLIQGEVVYEVR